MHLAVEKLNTCLFKILFAGPGYNNENETFCFSCVPHVRIIIDSSQVV